MRVQVRKVGNVIVTPEAHRRVAKCDSKNLCYACLEPLKPGDVVVRHDHERCYRALMRAIARGEFTEEDCIEKGTLGSQGAAGRKANHPALRDM